MKAVVLSTCRWNLFGGPGSDLHDGSDHGINVGVQGGEVPGYTWKRWAER